MPSPDATVELARVELLRGYRWLWQQDFWLLFLGAIGLFALFFGWVTFDVTREVGASIAAGESVPSWIGLAWSVVWLFMTGMLAWTGVGSESSLENDGHYLTIRPVADVVGGQLLAGACKFSVYIFALAVPAGAGIAVGLGTPTPLVGFLAAAVALVASAVAVGYPIGLAIKGVVRRSELLVRFKSVLGVAVFALYLFVTTTGRWVPLVEAVEPQLRAPPFAWLTDLALVTTPGADADPLGAGLAVAATALAVGLGVLASVPAGRYGWLADGARSETERAGAPDAPSHRVDRLLAVVCREPATRGIASTSLLRAVRAPQQLIFVAFPLLAAIPQIERLLAAGTLPWYAPWFVVWYGAWAGGALIPLNPLGNQGATLPTLLTTPADGRRVAHGHVVAAALPVAPATAALAVGAGIVAGRPGPELLALALAAVGAVVAGAVLAVGIGSLFPRFEAIDVSSSNTALPPSKVAYGVFSLQLTLTVAAAALLASDVALEVGAFLLTEWLPLDATVGTDALAGLAWAVLALTAASVPLAYRVAVGRIDDFQLA